MAGDSADGLAEASGGGAMGMEQANGLWIATPCYGGMVFQAYLRSILALQEAALARGLRLRVDTLANESLIPRARNAMVAMFLDRSAFSHFMFIDADLGFEPAQVFRMLEWDREIVGGIYPIKAIDWAGVREAARRGVPQPEQFGLNYVVKTTAEQTPIENGFAPVDYIGTGFLLVRRSALLRMIAHHPELKIRLPHVAGLPASGHSYALFDTMIDPDTGEYLSEDYTFCRRWRQMGGEIWGDFFSRLTHVGMQEFRGDLRARLLRQPPGPRPG